MHILFIGGTVFYGRTMVEQALSRGHEVTIFHRGQRGATLFEGQVHRIIGDRAEDIEKLGSGPWDAVIDTSGFFPKIVKKSAEYLADKAPLYCFISTISVYDDSEEPMTENSKLDDIIDPDATEITFETYGYLKWMCEDVVRESFPDRNLIIRPGLIVGPWDSSDRLTYWIENIARHDRVLIPEFDEIPAQCVDVRDLAAFTLDLIEMQVSDTINVTGPYEPLKLNEIWQMISGLFNPDVEFVKVKDDFLSARDIQLWTNLPFYMGHFGLTDGRSQIVLDRAKSYGLNLRPLVETLSDTHHWFQAFKPYEELKAGIKRDRELELIAEWESMAKE